MAKGTASPSTQKITLRIPEQTFDYYAERAIKRGRAPETEMAEHLTTTQAYSSLQPIYLSDNDRVTLSEIAGKLIRTPEDLISWARHIASISVAGTTVTLGDQLLTRLDSRRFGKTLPEHIRRTVVEQLEQVVGMR